MIIDEIEIIKIKKIILNIKLILKLIVIYLSVKYSFINCKFNMLAIIL
jgi:hypothetical protein